MSVARLGCFQGTTTPGVDMLTIFRKNELKNNPNSTLRFSKMKIVKLGIQCPPNTVVEVNGEKIPIAAGVFELGYDTITVTSLVFDSAVSINAMYFY